MKKNRIWKIVTVAAACITCFCFESPALPKDVLTQVQVRQSSADLTEGMTASVAWQQNEKGAASVLICDLDGRIVRQLLENAPMGSGAHQIQWDGRDINGKPCPVGAYLPIIKVKTETGRVGVHNPTASDWGAELPLQQPDYDIDQQEITFSLAKAALCLLRIGKAEGGPCYGTLLNWEPRPSGEVKLAWDGMDAQRVLNVGRRANLAFRLITITLPQNAILITGAPARSLPKETQYRRYPLHAPHGQNVFLHAYHSRDLCHDFTISAKMKKASRKWWGGKVARGTIEIAVDKKKDPQHIHLQREQFEIYLYVDDTFIREEKRSNVPASIVLDTTALSNGEHIVNVGLRTLEDHLGTYTMKINVDN